MYVIILSDPFPNYGKERKCYFCARIHDSNEVSYDIKDAKKFDNLNEAFDEAMVLKNMGLKPNLEKLD